jgi:hypothetical protein
VSWLWLLRKFIAACCGTDVPCTPRAMAVVSAMLTGLPRHLVLDAARLSIDDVIGHGANGIVHRGTLNGEPVCVKVGLGWLGP